MPTSENISREKLEIALKEIRRDVARLHRDAGYAGGDSVRFLFIIALIALAHLIYDGWHQGVKDSLGISAGIFITYAILNYLYVYWRSMRLLKEPVDPMWDTEVDLS